MTDLFVGSGGLIKNHLKNTHVDWKDGEIFENRLIVHRICDVHMWGLYNYIIIIIVRSIDSPR